MTVGEKTQARIKKENIAGKNIIPMLIRLLDEKHINIPVKSEKTSVAQMNRMKIVIDVLKDVFGSLAFRQLGLDGACCRGCFASMTNAEYCELRLGFGGGICYEIYDKLNLGKKRVYYYNNSISSAKSIYSGDKEAYAKVTFNDEIYTICWKPEVRTQTKKGKIKDEHEELIMKLIQKLGTHPVTGYEALPYGCTYVSNKRTKMDIAELNDTIIKYLNDETPIPLCSEKQAYWCAKFLDIDKEVAMNLNKYQASDILNVYFEKILTTQEEYDDVKAFYIAKLKKFI